MLPTEYRNVLVDVIPRLLPNAAGFVAVIGNLGKQQVMVNSVPLNATYGEAVRAIVDSADQQNWSEQLVDMLLKTFPTNADLSSVKGMFAAAAAAHSADPFHDVLLDGNRLFVDRLELRNTFVRVAKPDGKSVVLVGGAPKTGKTFSFFLLNHGASRCGYCVSRVMVSSFPQLTDLVEETLAAASVQFALPPQGQESAERWALKLAPIVGRALVAGNTQRFVVFDEFPASLPPETASFIVRLARYADETYPRNLRIVLVRFPGELTDDLEDNAERQELMPFTPLDMVQAMMRVAAARKWNIDEATVNAKVNEYEAGGTRSLRDRFLFLSSLFQALDGAV